jgi:hypothetical protein
MRFEKAGLELHPKQLCKRNSSFCQERDEWKGQNEAVWEECLKPIAEE